MGAKWSTVSFTVAHGKKQATGLGSPKEVEVVCSERRNKCVGAVIGLDAESRRRGRRRRENQARVGQ